MFFWIGAAVYPLMELAYRGRTHPSMSLAGGIGAAVLRKISRMDAPVWQLAAMGGMAITGIEYAVGKLFNRRYQVWDYRKTPLNYQGQICLPFTLAWCALSAGAIALLRWWDGVRAPVQGLRQSGGWPFRLRRD